MKKPPWSLYMVKGDVETSVSGSFGATLPPKEKVTI